MLDHNNHTSLVYDINCVYCHHIVNIVTSFTKPILIFNLIMIAENKQMIGIVIGIIVVALALVIIIVAVVLFKRRKAAAKKPKGTFLC